ncbi:MAG: nuclear transport factor 2 family protein [Verrucomicrobia bacterium]|nr:nuclear transport factor 2 family protein [Verrucomicrobiota bacterium]
MTSRYTLLLSTAFVAGLTVVASAQSQRPAQEQPPRREALTLTLGPSRGQQAAQEIAEAERAFARQGREKGSREAFLTWLGAEGLTFEPGPTKVAVEYPKRPDSKSVLLWGPDEVGASADGSMGFSSGPYLLRAADAKPEDPGRHGRFLSVWKRLPDGQWRVALDFGAPGGRRAEVPSSTAEVAVRFTGFATPRPVESRREAAAAQTAFFKALEAGDAKPVRAQLHDHFRAAWNATDGFVAGVRLPDTAWAQIAPRGSRFEVGAETTSEAGDFAYAHGRILSGDQVTGHWMSIWLRDADSDQWQLVRFIRNEPR